MEDRTRNIRLTLAYDGTAYHGFQRQAPQHGATVQGTLEDTWRRMFGEEIRMNMAGRTDAGVHAAGQVINFWSSAPIPLEKIPKAFNSYLPRDIRILRSREEGEKFNARRSARWKRYDYRIDHHEIADVFQRLYAWHEPVRLDRERMRRAAGFLEGKHDFYTFAAAGGVSRTFTRTLYRCRVGLEEELIRITCVGDGFLYNMVRIIAGTLLAVGKGKLKPEDMPEILSSRDRSRAGQTAPPQGLTLTYVHYGEEEPETVFPELFRESSPL
ncbi:MAG: tRNA pseudouridine(38-40) synthase TruA [Peptococcaceae bacterium]|jgi:tRNA pseudouridine38-40 synthase|nr:tRNA pseudouridine(38-40) synthase TruA [Peptococcaceae bacterium]